MEWLNRQKLQTKLTKEKTIARTKQEQEQEHMNNIVEVLYLDESEHEKSQTGKMDIKQNTVRSTECLSRGPTPKVFDTKFDTC